MPITANNTTVTDDGDTVCVILRQTRVFQFNRKTRLVVLNTGGFRTKTTLRRINQALAQYGIRHVARLSDFDRSNIISFTI